MNDSFSDKTLKSVKWRGIVIQMWKKETKRDRNNKDKKGVSLEQFNKYKITLFAITMMK